ncbi:MAG: acetyl-CoA carboxylase biotin carboxyl carrier protein subunit [Bacteroidia bacterium]
MFEAILDDTTLELEKKNGGFMMNGEDVPAVVNKLGERLWEVRYQDKNYRVLIHDINPEESTVTLGLNGKKTTVKLRSRLTRLLEEMGLGDALIAKIDSVKAPMPGLVRAINVKSGDSVSKGDPLFILEAMKMENVIKSPGDGSIASIHVEEGATVEKNEIMLKFN